MNKKINFAKAYPFDLQLFADEPTSQADSKPQEPAPQDKDDQEPKPNDKQTGRTYTDDDVNRIVNQKFAEWTKKKDKELEEARTEAQKLAKMNAEQKKQYELEKTQKKNEELQAQIDALKQEALRADLAKEAATTLQTDHKITATQDILDFVVGDTAEETNERIQKFVAIIQADRKNVEMERAIGQTPKNFNREHDEPSAFEKKLAKYRK